MTLINIITKKIPNQPPELYYGNKEYKISLVYSPKNINKILEKKASQMLFRLIEGDGKAIYFLGVNDDGTSDGIELNNLLISIDTLKNIAKILNITISKINIYNGNKGYIATIRLFKNISKKLILK